MTNEEIIEEIRARLNQGYTGNLMQYVGDCRANIKWLLEQLTEYQRREKSAVEDILIASDKGRCKVCKHMQEVEMCQKWPNRSCFEWRGVEVGGE